MTKYLYCWHSNTMFAIWKLIFIYGFSYFVVECLIPTLNVQKGTPMSVQNVMSLLLTVEEFPRLELILTAVSRHAYHKHALSWALDQCLKFQLNWTSRIDRNLIERKRQDTLEMCRMFNEENNRLDSFGINRDGGFKLYEIDHNSRRNKREVKPPNSTLDFGEAKRIETIVDKLYDDMAEHGERVTYRQRNLTTTKVPTAQNHSVVQNETARRFHFAPAILIADTTTDHMLTVTKDTSYVIPWKKHWRHGIVPYFIDPNTYDSQLSDIIIKAFDYFEKATCIRLQRLRERPTDIKSLRQVEWLYITNPSGIRQCVHSNERKENKGVQMVVFGYDCLSLGEVLHEVMHILGFSHEHTRPDRDQYITVLWDNIKPGYKKYFETRTADPLSGFPYDYTSVLHYPSRAFSRNGQVTILTESGVKIGQREGLSDNDIAKVTAIYSPECTKRNKEYLIETCPSVVKLQRQVLKNVTKSEIENYFKDRLWPYGIINYKIKDNTQFSSEERENLKAVIRHIEKETCIEFRDISAFEDEENKEKDNDTVDTNLNLHLDIKNETNDEMIAETANNKLDSASKEVIEAELQVDKQSLTSDFSQVNATDNENIELKETEENLVILRTNDTPKISKILTSSNPSYTFGNLYKKPKNKQKQQVTSNSNTNSAGRRHAESILTLVRSQEPGCRCPSPGRPKGDQVLSINSDCFNSVNDLLHLFVHILGLDHQHNMHDRDSYLRILWANLPPGISNEIKKKLPPAASVGFPYDYQSVMHYPWLDIKEGVTNVMYPIWNDGWAMGHWQGLSSTDVNKLNLIYYEQCSLRKAHTQKYIIN